MSCTIDARIYLFTEDMRETYPELLGQSFTEKETEGIYQKVVDKREYPDFDDWLADMLKSGLVIPIMG